MLLPFVSGFRLLVDQFRFWVGISVNLFFPPPPDAGPEPDEESIHATISDIRRLLRVALSEGFDHDIAQALNDLAEKRDVIERAFVVWTDLIEVLVQQQEKLYGPRAGLGSIKAAELKKIFKYLLRNQKFKLPKVPAALEPLVVDYVIDWMVDVVVTACNHYGLWEEVEPRSGYPWRVFIARAIQWLARLFSPIVRAIASIILWVRHAIAEQVLLSQEIRTALDAIEKEGLIVRSDEIIGEVKELISFMADHRKQLKAGFELVLVAVQEAETFASLSGPEKKRYATNLVFAVLDELGFVQRYGSLATLIKSLISVGIEISVHLFNKRGVFAT